MKPEKRIYVELPDFSGPYKKGIRKLLTKELFRFLTYDVIRAMVPKKFTDSVELDRPVFEAKWTEE